MSATIKYKGSTIADITETATKTLKTSGKYCETDIVVENTKDGGGGGGLPSSISKIDGGSFTLASETSVSSYSISHNLGEKPSGFVVWTDDVIYGESESNSPIIVNLMLKVCNYSETNIAAYCATRKSTSGVFGQYNNTVAATAESSWLSESYIICGLGSSVYKPGANYNWIAWV